MVALGDERTIEQDPAFAIRILVDVANLALSPAVNDPTTAVQVLDYLGETLRLVGTTELSVQSWEDTRPREAWSSPLAAGRTTCRCRPTRSGSTAPGESRSCAVCGRCSRSSTTRSARSTEPRSATSWSAWMPPSRRAWEHSVDFERASTADTQGIGGPRTRPVLAADHVTHTR